MLPGGSGGQLSWWPRALGVPGTLAFEWMSCHSRSVRELWGLAPLTNLRVPFPESISRGRTSSVGLWPRVFSSTDCAWDALILFGSRDAHGFLQPGHMSTHRVLHAESLGLRANTWGWREYFPLSLRHGWQAPCFQHHSDHISKKRLPVPRSDKGAVLPRAVFAASMWERLEHIRQGASGYTKQTSLRN